MTHAAGFRCALARVGKKAIYCKADLLEQISNKICLLNFEGGIYNENFEMKGLALSIYEIDASTGLCTSKHWFVVLSKI